MRSQGGIAKFDLLPRGLINSVYAVRQLHFVAGFYRYLLAKGLRVLGFFSPGSGRKAMKKLVGCGRGGPDLRSNGQKPTVFFEI